MKYIVPVVCCLIGAAVCYPQQQKYQQKPQQQQKYQQQPQQQQQQYQQQPQQQQQQQYQQQPQQYQQKATTPPVPIISLDNSVNYDGSYRFSFENGDGTRQSQEGQLRTIGQEAGEVSQGSYSYVGDDGKTYSIKYVADENGFHAEGDHLPQPPPIPEAIRKSLEYLATAPPTPAEPNQ